MIDVTKERLCLKICYPTPGPLVQPHHARALFFVTSQLRSDSFVNTSHTNGRFTLENLHDKRARCAVDPAASQRPARSHTHDGEVAGPRDAVVTEARKRVVSLLGNKDHSMTDSLAIRVFAQSPLQSTLFLETAMPQLISRIKHADKDTANIVKSILRRILC